MPHSQRSQRYKIGGSISDDIEHEDGSQELLVCQASDTENTKLGTFEYSFIEGIMHFRAVECEDDHFIHVLLYRSTTLRGVDACHY